MTIKHQPAPKADQARTIDAFAPVEVEVKPPLDRSTLEAWTVCPYQAHAIEAGEVKVVGELAVAGELAHQAFSAATLAWVESNMALSPKDLAQEIENAALAARPDLQPEVLEATRWMTWDWANYLSGIHISNIRGFDGGEACGKSGQFSAELAGETITTEFDFLVTIGSEGWDNDFKTGWKNHDDEVISGSFQFADHAVIAFENFPEMQTLYVRCWNTRKNRRSAWVAYQRRNAIQYRALIGSAIHERAKAHATGVYEPWPTLEKCRICPVVARCPAADAYCAADPIALGQRLIVLGEAYEHTKKILEAYVDRTGEDVVLPSGEHIGRHKPAEKKKPLAVYGGEK